MRRLKKILAMLSKVGNALVILANAGLQIASLWA